MSQESKTEVYKDYGLHSILCVILSPGRWHVTFTAGGIRHGGLGITRDVQKSVHVGERCIRWPGRSDFKCAFSWSHFCVGGAQFRCIESITTLMLVKWSRSWRIIVNLVVWKQVEALRRFCILWSDNFSSMTSAFVNVFNKTSASWLPCTRLRGERASVGNRFYWLQWR